MRHAKTILVLLFIFASAIASLMIRHHASAAIRDHAGSLQQQAQQIASLKAEKERLSNLVSQVASSPVTDHSAELENLRTRVEVLRKQTNDLAHQEKNRLTSQSAQLAAKPENYTPVYGEPMSRLRGKKGMDALFLTSAIWAYAEEHQRQYPTSLDQVAPYLTGQHRTLSGTNQFELVFQGSLEQLDGIPKFSVAGVRETQTWLGPDGNPTRVYGMIDGSIQTVTSHDNFQAWEAEHVIFAPSSAK